MKTKPLPGQFPSYHLPPGFIAGIAWAALFNRKRVFQRDAKAAIKGIFPPPVICGEENLPARGPCLIVLNHYYRPGYDAWWTALAISALTPFEIHWVMTGAFTYPGQRRERVLKPVSQWALSRVGRVYGFTNMPAMPPDPRELDQRTRAVRQVVNFAQRSKDPVIGLAPEGRDILTGQLGDPPSGSGRFMAHLAGLEMPFLPVGIFENEGALHIRFGAAYVLTAPEGLSAAEIDRTVNQAVMGSIAALLPVKMRGTYG